MENKISFMLKPHIQSLTYSSKLYKLSSIIYLTSQNILKTNLSGACASNLVLSAFGFEHDRLRNKERWLQIGQLSLQSWAMEIVKAFAAWTFIHCISIVFMSFQVCDAQHEQILYVGASKIGMMKRKEINPLLANYQYNVLMYDY